MPYRRSFAVLLLFAGLAPAQPPSAEVRERYTKYEYRIPMRDGVRLFTAVYVPKDDSQTYPLLLMRTPYSVGPYGIDRYPDRLGPSDLFQKAGYIFVQQDVRGRWMSEGEYANMRPHRPGKKGPAETDESSDTYDTIDWLLKRVPGHNSKVGQWGISYPGFYTSCGLIDAHPALKASSPQAPICDWFVGDDFHHNGAFFLPHCFNFMANFGRPRPSPIRKSPYLPFDHESHDGYDFFLRLGPLANADARHYKGQIAFWNELMKHDSYNDFWKVRNLRPHLKNVKPAVLTVGGWFDAENLFGALETYRSVETQSPGAKNVLVMGPWTHGGWHRNDGDKIGDVTFGAKTGVHYREKVEFPFFEYHLKSKGDGKFPEAAVFETGTNVWRRYESWPPAAAKTRSYYFHPRGRLGTAPAEASGDSGHDEYVSDPSKPVPYHDKINIGMAPEYMTGDQRSVGRRPDVLVYQTEPLEEDVTILGPLTADLHVSTSGTDSDWVVKLIDVYPDDFPDPDPNPAGVRMGGYQQLVRGEVFRGKFRSDYATPRPFTPDQPDLVSWKLPDVNHTFRARHRIMVQVQSTWFPLVDRNPQTFVNINTATEADFRKATQRVYRTAERASRMRVLVLP